MNDFHDENDFNPDVNYEDAEFLEHAKKTLKAAQYLQQQHAQQYNNKVLGDLWHKTLQEEGLDQGTYNELTSQDPQLVQELLGENMKNLVQKVKRGRDAKGRYTKQTPQREVRQPSLGALEQKAKTGSLSESEEMELLDAVLGKLF